MLKILLFHVGFGLRTEVIMGYLISDQFKNTFLNVKSPYKPVGAPYLISRKPAKKLIFNNFSPTISK